jgi:UDP-N-acetylbacillosamine N-acetyltransferase
MLSLIGKYDCAFFVVDDKWHKPGMLYANHQVISSGQFFEQYFSKVDSAFSLIADREWRRKFDQICKAAGVELPPLIHPEAYISSSASVGDGTVIKAGAICDVGVDIGRLCIIDNGCIIPHHCSIGNYVHIAPGVALGGEVKVGDRSLLGIGSRIASKLVLPEAIVTGPGSVITRIPAPGDVLTASDAQVIGKNKHSVHLDQS